MEIESHLFASASNFIESANSVYTLQKIFFLYFYTKYNDWFIFWANSFEIIIYDDKCNRNNAQMSAKIAMLRRKNESFECILCEPFID